MSVVPIRNLGVSDISTNKTYLYRNGDMIVPLDNTGYKQNDNYTSDGGWTLQENAMYGLVPTSNAHNRAVITSNQIDLRDYSLIVVKAVINGETILYTHDISGLSASRYVIANINRTGSGGRQIGVGISTVKPSFWTATAGNVTSATINASEVYIKEIWLQK